MWSRAFATADDQRTQVSLCENRLRPLGAEPFRCRRSFRVIRRPSLFPRIIIIHGIACRSVWDTNAEQHAALCQAVRRTIRPAGGLVLHRPSHPGGRWSRRERLSTAMQHVSVACRQDPRTAPGRVAADGLRRRTRPPPPRRNEYRVVRPAVRRSQSRTRPDSGHVARRARKPAPACREGEGRTTATKFHHR